MQPGHVRMLILVACWAAIAGASVVTLYRMRRVGAWLQACGAVLWFVLYVIDVILAMSWPKTSLGALTRWDGIEGWWLCEYYLLHPLAAVLFAAGLVLNVVLQRRIRPEDPV